MRVLVHIRADAPHRRRDEDIELAQIPHVGEYVTLSADSREWYRVVLVVHHAFRCTVAADVYAVGYDRRQALESAGAGPDG